MVASDQALEELLTQAPGWVAELQGLLDSEFELLKLRDVPALEVLQAQKTGLLTKLNQIALSMTGRASKPPVWLAQQRLLESCAQAHLRNVKLMQRQLDAVRGALQALQGETGALSVDLYDRLGQVARRSGALMYQTA